MLHLNLQEQLKIPKLLSSAKKFENPVESPSSCTEVRYCYNSIGSVSTKKEISNCQHPSSAPLNALGRRTPQAAVLAIVLLKETPVSEYREHSREEGEKKFLLCRGEEDTTLHNRGVILPQHTGKGKEISAEHLSIRFGVPSIFKQQTVL